MTAAVNSFGTQLQLGDGVGGFTTIAEVKDLTGFGFTKAVHDASHHSTPNGFEEFVASGLKRSREFQVPVNFIPSAATQGNTSGLLALFNNGTRRPYKMILTTAPTATWAFDAEVLGFEQMAPVDGLLGATFTLKPTGLATLT